VSIVKDGLLWGLVACHNETPKNLTCDVRTACRMLAGSLARQVRAKEEAEAYRERLRLRSAEDVITQRLARMTAIDDAITGAQGDIQRMLGANGFALVQGGKVDVYGSCPTAEDVRELAQWLGAETRVEPFATHQLSRLFPRAAAYREAASGLLTVTLSSDTPIVFMWFRAEQVEVINWAGNPHKAVDQAPGQSLNPRASFDAWSETVRGLARPWTLGEIEAAQRIKGTVAESRQNRRLLELNTQLTATLAEKERLLQQKDFLVKEVNHRVQNSLQLVSAFLSMQSRSIKDPVLTGHLDEAQRRLSAVSLVHKRLYRDDNVETVDLSRYLEDLCIDTRQSMGGEGGDQLAFDLAPILIASDRAVSVGLILTELVINANKYAYGGGAGQIAITLEQYRNRFLLIVADQGSGLTRTEKGFGTRMMQAMVDRLQGTIDYADNEPGLRVIVSAPIEENVS
jgi:light-regulated signal transduction histidine kinase (bacteriophytochrome)